MTRAFVTVSVAAAALMLTACEDRGSQNQGMEQTAAGEPGAGQEQAYGAGEQQAQQGQPGDPETDKDLVLRSKSEQAQGEVTDVEADEGTLTLRTQQGQDLDLHGTPQQLQSYQIGQQASVEFRSFEGTYWLTNPSPSAGGGEMAAAGGQQVQGRVTGVEPNEGTITLEGAQPSDFRAHPQELTSIRPGQMVSLTYKAMGDNNWVQQIQGDQQQGSQQQGSQQQMGGQQGAQQQPEGQGAQQQGEQGGY